MAGDHWWCTKLLCDCKVMWLVQDFFFKAIYPFTQSLRTKLGPQCCSVSYPGGIIHTLGKEVLCWHIQMFQKCKYFLGCLFFGLGGGRSDLCIDNIVFNKLTGLCGIKGFNHS